MTWKTTTVIALSAAFLAWLLTEPSGLIVGVLVPPAILNAVYWCGLGEGLAIFNRKSPA